MQSIPRPAAMQINPMIGNTPRDTLANVCDSLDATASHSDAGLALLLRSMSATLRYESIGSPQ